MLIMALGVMLLAGCEAEVVHVPPRVITSPAPPPEVGTTMVRKTPDKTFNPAEMDVKVGDEKALESLIAKHKGEIVFVDYWALWCHPCVDAFPHTVDAFEKYRDRGLTAIAVSFDDPAEKEEEVRRFLAKHRADFENLISPYEAGPEPFDKFGISQVPHFRLYDRQGKLRKQWDSEPKDLDAKVQELLAEK
jgi:thiol-disulfide isomerase/thioredoxin